MHMQGFYRSANPITWLCACGTTMCVVAILAWGPAPSSRVRLRLKQTKPSNIKPDTLPDMMHSTLPGMEHARELGLRKTDASLLENKDARLHTSNTSESLHSTSSDALHAYNDTFALLEEGNPARQLIITSTTCGYLDMTLNWIAQLRSINLTNFLVIAEDLPAYEFLLTIAPRNIMTSSAFGRPFSRASHKAAAFDSTEFNWCSRPYYLGELIRRNFSAVWIDSDAALLKDPFGIVPATAKPIVLVDDEPHLKPIKKYNRYVCSCFVMVRPSGGAHALLSAWAQLCGNRTQDQPPLNEALDMLTGAVAWDVMPKPQFPCGYDAERLTLTGAPGWQAPAWIHPNWRTGGRAKEEFLKQFGLWRNLRAPLHCGV